MPKKGGGKKLNKVKKPTKMREAELWAFFCSLPKFLRKKEPRVIQEMGYDIPEELDEIFEIRTKKQFEEKYTITSKQLGIWEQCDWFKKKVAEFEKMTDVRHLKKDIDASFSRKVIKEGDAPRVKLWHQLYAGYIENQEHKHSGEIKTTVELTEEQTKELMKHLGKLYEDNKQ